MERTPAQTYASTPRRALAYLLDAIALGAAAAIVASRLTDAQERRLHLTAALAGVLGTAYHVILEGHAGQTLGKRILGIAVVGEDGAPCTYRAATIRTGFRAVDWLPVGYALGTASIVSSPRGQRLGDRAAGTVVVRTDEAVDSATVTADDVPVERHASMDEVRP